MAQIIENQDGRRMIRLSADDVLNVVQLYQQHLYGKEPAVSYEAIRAHLQAGSFYLPEDL